MAVMGSIRLLLVDDNEAMRESLRQILEPGFEVVGTLDDGAGLAKAVDESRPDVILLDIGLPKVNGLEAATRLLATRPDAKIIFRNGPQRSFLHQGSDQSGGIGLRSED